LVIKKSFQTLHCQIEEGGKIAVGSKIEYIIAKTLDSFDVDFEYEPLDFYTEYHIKSDFRIYSKNGIFLGEHLGLLNKDWYKNRWF
jgi:hypothetical protein